jgi:Family of unknown function (DUF5996)
MSPVTFPPLDLADWKEPRDTLHKYCRLVGAIREAMSKPLPYVLHTNLLLSKRGFTTSSILKEDSTTDKSFEVILDVQNRRLRIESNYGESLSVALTGQSINALCDETCSPLHDIGIKPPLERPSFLDGIRGQFDSNPVKAYWKAVSSTKRVLKKIKTELGKETGPIQLRVDNLTLSLTWYCIKVFGEFPVEQIDLGFSTGDEVFTEAYFFISSFPDAGSLKTKVSNKERFLFTKNNSEMILPYSEVSKAKNSEKTLLDFYRSAQK